MVGDSSEHVGEVMLRVEAVELGAFNQRIDRGGAAAAGIGAGKQIIFTANGSRAVILPMSGRKLKSITAGTRSMGGAFGVNMSSSGPAAKWFTSKRRPVSSSWWRHGCSTRPPVPEWAWGCRGSRYRRWLNCTIC